MWHRTLSVIPNEDRYISSISGQHVKFANHCSTKVALVISTNLSVVWHKGHVCEFPIRIEISKVEAVSRSSWLSIATENEILLLLNMISFIWHLYESPMRIDLTSLVEVSGSSNYTSDNLLIFNRIKFISYVYESPMRIDLFSSSGQWFFLQVIHKKWIILILSYTSVNPQWGSISLL